MNDSTIVRMATETARHLRHAVSVAPVSPHLLPSYNALLHAAQSNHPHDAFLSVLQPILPEKDDQHEAGLTIAEFCALLGLIAIALESLNPSLGPTASREN